MRPVAVMWKSSRGINIFVRHIVISLVKPSDLIILMVTGTGVNSLNLEERVEKAEKEKDWDGEKREREAFGPLLHFPLCKVSHHQEKNHIDKLATKQEILFGTCTGVVIAAVDAAGVLGVAGVEAAEGWGRELDVGCEEEEEDEEEEFTVAWTGVRWVTLDTGGSARSTLFSWLLILSEKISDFSTLTNRNMWVSQNVKKKVIWQSYREARDPSGWETDFETVGAGLETVTASSVAGVWADAGLTVVSLLVCSVFTT